MNKWFSMGCSFVYATIGAAPLFIWVYPSFFEWMRMPIDEQLPAGRAIMVLVLAGLVFGLLFLWGMLANDIEARCWYGVGENRSGALKKVIGGVVLAALSVLLIGAAMTQGLMFALGTLGGMAFVLVCAYLVV